MIQELFIALFKVGLPIGAMAYLLVWWALRNGFLSDVETVKDVEAQVKRQAKDEEGKKAGDPIHRKWLALGGGFYGVVALFTLTIIELNDILDFLRNFAGFESLANLLSVSTLIGILIETLMNTFMALAWPFYWMSDVQVDYAWIWFAMQSRRLYQAGNLFIAVFHLGLPSGSMLQAQRAKAGAATDEQCLASHEAVFR